MLRSPILSAADWDVLCPWLLLRKSLKNAFTFRLLFVTTIHILFVSFLLAAAFGWFAASRTVGDFLNAYSPISVYVPHNEQNDSEEILNELLQEEPTIPKMNPLSNPKSPYKSVSEFVNQFNEETDAGAETATKTETATRAERETKAQNETKAETPSEQLPQETRPSLSWLTVSQRTAAVIYAFLSTLLLWLVVARRMALHVTRGLNVSFRQIFSQIKTQIPVILGAYVFLLIGLAFLALPLLLVRWLTGLAADSGVILGVLTFLGLIYSTFYFFFLLGSAIGAFFIPSVFVTEHSDTFDALSRSFSYALQRPLRFVFYVLAAFFFGLLGLLAMIVFVAEILQLYKYAVGFCVVENPVISATLYAFSWVVSAYIFLFFVSAVQGIYLLLRRDVDAVELDAIWLPAPQGVPAPSLPELKGEAEPSK